jgi:hypothetical protein
MVTMKNGYFTHKDMAFTAFTMQKYGISLGISSIPMEFPIG